MRNIRTLFTTFLFILAMNTVTAQEPVVIVFNGTLASSETQTANRDCHIDFFMHNEALEPLLVRSVKVSTDSAGQFAFFIRDIPAVFTSGARIPSAKITIAIQPNAASAGAGMEDTRVEYTLRKTGLTGYSITRMDNQVMEQSYDQQVWSFWDVSPCTYLTGSFYISFYNNLTDVNRIYQLGWQQQMKMQQGPGAGAVTPLQRGIKGGYAVGGYKKTQ